MYIYMTHGTMYICMTHGNMYIYMTHGNMYYTYSCVPWSSFWLSVTSTVFTKQSPSYFSISTSPSVLCTTQCLGWISLALRTTCFQRVRVTHTRFNILHHYKEKTTTHYASKVVHVTTLQTQKIPTSFYVQEKPELVLVGDQNWFLVGTRLLSIRKMWSFSRVIRVSDIG